ncbi:hypothetical protein ACTXT7_011102 [Hymenolepis weldensis]
MNRPLLEKIIWLFMASVITVCYYFYTNLKSRSNSDWYDKLLKSAMFPALRLTMFARAAVDVVGDVISIGLEAVELQPKNIRSQINKFHVLIETIPPSLIVQFTNIIQNPSPNPYGNLKAAILQHTQPFAAERVQKLVQQECVGDLRPNALLTWMKLLAPG